MENNISSKNNTVIEEALGYERLGLSVIQLGSITKGPDAKKIIQYIGSWKPYQERRARPEEIKNWTGENLGIVTGLISRLCVVDLDSYKKGYDKELERSLGLPLTPTSQTASGGKQLYFRLPEGIMIKNAVCIGKTGSGIDIRADGGMVIAPPSKTPYGEYTWVISPFEIPFADLPHKILELIGYQKNGGTKAKKHLVELAGLREGEGRNSAMASVIGKLVMTTQPKNWDDEVWPVAQQINNTYQPPMEHEELLGIYNSITKIELMRRSNTENESEEPDGNEYAKEESLLRSNFLDPRDQKGAVYRMARYLAERFHIKTVGKRDQSREVYIYRNGIYEDGLGFIKKEIQRILSSFATQAKKKEVLDTLKDMAWVERSFFDPLKNLINFKNGVYDIESKKLLLHDPSFPFLTQLPVTFDETADCPGIKNFLNQILNEESVQVIQEWIGYTLYRAYFIKKAIIFVGEKDTGKTTWLRIKEKFLGQKNVSGVSLQKISADRFSLSNLYAKYANIYDDLSFKDINDNGTFKMLTGGGTVTGEIKFGDHFQFENYAKLTFSCNKIPPVTDMDDEAYFSRWILIRFEHPPKVVDKFLVQKITTDAELSGLANFALEGLYRLLRNQDFSYKQTPEQVKIEMSLSASSLAQFAHTQLQIVPDPKAYITKDDMYQAFIDYAKAEELPVITKEVLGRNLPKFIKVSNSTKSLKIDDGKARQVACWLGVEFKNQGVFPSSVKPEEPVTNPPTLLLDD